MNNSTMEAIISEVAEEYPPLITFQEAAKIARVPKGTINSWSSANQFDEFRSRKGKRVLLHRDSFVRLVLENTN